MSGIVNEPVCKHCGKTEQEHCERFEQMPYGCICDPGEWARVTPICSKYIPMRGAGSHCKTCEHDYACHVDAPHNRNS